MSSLKRKKENVLLIEVDQMPWFCLGRTWGKNLKTPNLDKLVDNGGVVFENATCQSPICLPSRVSMLSGQYVSTTKQFGFSGYCQRGIDYLHSYLKDSGYITGAFGKFHCVSVGYDKWNFDEAAPTLPEDDDFSIPENNNYTCYCRELGIKWPTDQMHGHDPYKGHNIPPHRIPEAATAEMSSILDSPCLSDVPKEHSLETWTTNKCLDWIQREVGNERPFFIWLSYDRPHFPTALPEEWLGRVKPDDIELHDIPSENDLTNLPKVLFDEYKKISIFNKGEKFFKKILAVYYSLIEWIDDEIGRVIKELEELGIYDETTIIFTADHGDEAGFNGLFNKNRNVYSSAITRVPFIIKPRARSIDKKLIGKTIHEPVELVDIFPTLCSLNSLDIPKSIEGHDLSGFLSGVKALNSYRPVFCEDYYKRMVEKNNWKLIFDIEKNSECHLFNMKDDPNQFKNLYSSPDCISQRIELKRELLSFLCQRIFGPYNDFDINRIKRGLDPTDKLFPIHVAMGYRQDITFNYFRAAVSLSKKNEYEVLVPFYDENILFFEHVNQGHIDGYRTLDQAMAPKQNIVEEYLDHGLRVCMNGICPISTLLVNSPIDSPLSSIDDAVNLIKLWRNKNAKNTVF